MDFKQARKIAFDMASLEFGSNVEETIVEGTPSNLSFRVRKIIDHLNYLVDCFEIQKLAYEKDNPLFLDKFYNEVTKLIDGDGQEFIGLKDLLKMLYFLRVFEREPIKKKATSILLKHYINYINDNVEVLPIEDYMELIEEKRYNGNYFDKKYVFAELLNIIEDKNSV